MAKEVSQINLNYLGWLKQDDKTSQFLNKANQLLATLPRDTQIKSAEVLNMGFLIERYPTSFESLFIVACAQSEEPLPDDLSKPGLDSIMGIPNHTKQRAEWNYLSELQWYPESREIAIPENLNRLLEDSKNPTQRKLLPGQVCALLSPNNELRQTLVLIATSQIGSTTFKYEDCDYQLRRYEEESWLLDNIVSYGADVIATNPKAYNALMSAFLKKPDPKIISEEDDIVRKITIAEILTETVYYAPDMEQGRIQARQLLSNIVLPFIKNTVADSSYFLSSLLAKAVALASDFGLHESGILMEVENCIKQLCCAQLQQIGGALKTRCYLKAPPDVDFYQALRMVNDALRSQNKLQVLVDAKDFLTSAGNQAIRNIMARRIRELSETTGVRFIKTCSNDLNKYQAEDISLGSQIHRTLVTILSIFASLHGDAELATRIMVESEKRFSDPPKEKLFPLQRDS
ncbi:hypothetical protein AUK04_03115 [Candidatus Roizmanbacteria bacterium CG2_30_33_16]|uniref:Uncharacterized protein n=4 Tax=Candidatus Roizmaniibacteriota TaxID=1752723 RepID=A0A2H0C370_9BACT|nr:hypothetical protein [Candidatus Roizmanbacteria bacterium]OIP83700.1 MAG: hypothetical protein AUK04_03115 [Candidatus Roizmanbacteria bacterium CG2_30_33_16]PIP64365.1 MAG: hypothetical protein COW96_02945 [Candidatus Roizmanbacteria bacterium CG22_combo_CG10-13_8_21_14_all_33_16]PIX74595.1 MAG: hypothetical protein COZ39_00155 [Candidatus Roizmanbacteria bacterium CG_4_10_14_3_um_filter_33_21]PJB87988.1 MAG: hypothetical protein CO083_04130 [Candidatus Roizmanbacteria bacterium CG_4_9_14_